jgi:hypothetical protein
VVAQDRGLYMVQYGQGSQLVQHEGHSFESERRGAPHATLAFHHTCSSRVSPIGCTTELHGCPDKTQRQPMLRGRQLQAVDVAAGHR